MASPPAIRPVTIRRMTRDDLDVVMAIEADAFPSSWSRADFTACMDDSRCEARVAVRGPAVVGLAVWEMRDGGLHVTNLAVDKDRRRQGVGTRLVKHVTQLLDPSRCRYVYLEVREGNLPAQLFYRRLGFRATRVLRNHYPDTHEDGYLMEYWPAR